MPHSTNRTPAAPRRRAVARLAVALAALSALGLGLWRRARPATVDAALLRLLQSDDPRQRKRGAWRVAREAGARAGDLLRPHLSAAREPDPDVREAFVYALGQLGGRSAAELAEELARTDESGYVRAAAWLALARCDPQRYRALAGARSPDRDAPWDQIGLARAWAALGDFRGLADLLHWAVAGDHSQRVVAATTLHQRLAPLLEAVGRWPLAAQSAPGRPWAPELVARVRRRAAGLDLNGLARQLRARLVAGQRIRRDVHRLASARDWLARRLYRR